MFDLICKTYFLVGCFYYLLAIFTGGVQDEKVKSIRTIATSAFALAIVAVPIALLIAALQFIFGA
tara:strand:- start:13460 stop:13654 length:195 start_codon:yes stop_codon:yes gene_type:complete